MIVPQYWAESRIQHRQKRKQVTVRRFGWSDTNQADAQAKADLRAQEAFQRIISGENLVRREPKIPYNGAEGVPIREEIVSRHGEAIVTRNSYGARCLNTPDVLFADVDFDVEPGCEVTLIVIGLLVAGSAAVGWITDSMLLAVVLGILSVCLGYAVALLLFRATLMAKGGDEQAARKCIASFVDQHREWNVRIYRTPAGLRVLATHRTFSPSEPDVVEFFNALGTDPLYARMCFNQQCFRARVSPKPWRIGIKQHMKPRPGVWPVAPERLDARNAWIEEYEAAARQYASCRLVETLGSGVVHHDVRIVQELHDEMARATSELPIA